MTATTRLLTVTCLICVVAAGCGTTEKKEPRMTPDEARHELTSMARAVLGSLSPGHDADVDRTAPPTPCGGLGGNEYTKVKYGLSVDLQPAGDRATLFASARDKLRALGYTVTDPETMGDNTSLTFHGEAVSGDLTDHGDGKVSFGAETTCLDNPSSSSP